MRQELQAELEFCVFDVAGVAVFGLSICYEYLVPGKRRVTLTANGWSKFSFHPVLTGTPRSIDPRLRLRKRPLRILQCMSLISKRLGLWRHRSVLCGFALGDDPASIMAGEDIVPRRKSTSTRSAASGKPDSWGWVRLLKSFP